MKRRRRAYAAENGLSGPDQVTSIIQGYWVPITQAFKQAGYNQPNQVTRLQVDSKAHDSCRHYAMAKMDGSVLIVGPEIVDLPPDNITAILAHEAGHFVDFASPGRFWFRSPQAIRVRSGARAISLSVKALPPDHKGPVLFFFQDLPTKGLSKHLREWENRGRDEEERVADEIASYVLGKPIRYTGSRDCLVQSIGRGVERPIGLR